MRERMTRFMMGRYGSDPLNQVMMIAALVLVFASMLWQPLYVIALALMIWVLFRMFSRNVAKRQAEAMAYERVKSSIVRFFKTGAHMIFGTKTHRYYKCPGCKQQVRVPRGKGKININCPKCQTSFTKKT